MKKLLLALMMISLVALFAVPAVAQESDCNVHFDVDATKTVTIDQTVTITKDLNLYVDATFDPDEWAQAEAYKCDHNTGNYVEDEFSTNTNEICTSFNGFAGIAQVNQAAGSLNNQGNVVAVAVTNSNGFNSYTLSHAEVAIEKVNTFNVVDIDDTTYTDQICTSFNGFSGIAQVNQASGHMNNQNNAAGIAANLGNRGAVALTDSYLTMTNTNNRAEFGDEEGSVVFTASIGGSFNGGSSGIAQVNQSPGSMNNQANSVAISYAGRP
jgi:hypothetical protein